MIKNFMRVLTIVFVSTFVYLNPFGQIEAYANTYDLNFNGGYVADQANVLTDQQETQLNSLSKQLESKTSAELAVVTLKSLNGKSIDEAGLAIGRDYGIGKKKLNNGIILIVAPKDRKLRIEVGYGLEGVIPDSVAGRIRDEYMTDNFKEKKWFDGLSQASQAISYRIAKDKKIELTGISNDVTEVEHIHDFMAEHPLWFIFIVICLVILFLALMVASDGSCCGGYYGGSSSGGSSFGGGGFGGGGCSGGF